MTAYAAKRRAVPVLKAKAAAVRRANSAVLAAKARAKRAADPEAARAYQRAWSRANPDKEHAKRERHKPRKQDKTLQRKYGITADQRDAILRAQGGCCAACGSCSPGSKYGWHTDHDHATGEVRGILCRACNALLGMLGDNLLGVEEAARRFATYLKGAPARVRKALAT